MPFSLSRAARRSFGLPILALFIQAFMAFGGTARAAALWPTAALGQLTVCWEQPGFAQEKGWVQAVIQREYGAKTKLRFTGWEDCSQTGQAHIRVGVFDFPTNTKGLAADLDGMRYGIVLNFTFAQWNRPCQATRQACIEGLAVHEFGHAAGLPDTLIPWHGDSATCIGKSIHHLTSATLALDAGSIMNYCNTEWEQAQLDPSDVAALQQLYP